MALQDGLLSFAIKETIFLSSDRAGIGELQELELIPDVEVLENQSYISITGCLQLYGKYEPIRDAAQSNRGGTETLIEAMTFSPFRQDGLDGQFYGWEEQIGHRIPLNITIPVERIAELDDIYAIVDSFDYSLESPHQLLIEAELKIAGIRFTEQTQDDHDPVQAQSPYETYAYEEKESAAQEEAWEFAHVASDQADAEAEPASLDEIEQKLYELEQEMERQAQIASYESAESTESTSLFDTPALPVVSHLANSYPVFGEVTEADYPETDVEAVSYQHDDDLMEPMQESVGFQPEPMQESAGFQPEPMQESAGFQPEPVSAYEELPQAQKEQWEDVSVPQTAEEEELVLAIHEDQETEYAPMAAEELQPEELYTEEVEPTSQEMESNDEPEVRVAISGKASREESGNLNITSIFSQASRAKQEAQALEAESSSSSSLKGGSAGTPSTLEAMQNLTSFVRSREERSSQLKMCIIQRDETLESISQRYSLPVSRILEVNRLTSEQLVAGQILYIPQ